MMKTTKLLKYSVSLLIFSVLATLTACGNKSGDSNNTVVQPTAVCGVNLVCNQTGVGGSTIFQGESQDWYGVIKLSMSFLAQNPVTTSLQNTYNPYGSIYGGGSNYGSYYPTTPAMISYSGPVAVNGTMTALQSLNLGMCQLPVGTYSLITIGSGQWMQTQVSNLRLQATGPANVVLNLSQGMVSAGSGIQGSQLWTDNNAIGRIFGNIVIESVNGYPCNMSVLVQ